MSRDFTHPEYGTIRTVARPYGRYIINLKDLMRGMTLIDEQGTLNRVSSADLMLYPSRGSNREWYMKDSAVQFFLSLTNNSKARAFARWMRSEVIPALQKTGLEALEKREHEPEPLEPTATALTPETFHHDMFGDIRAVSIDGEPWFVGKDIAERLEYTNPAEAIQDNVDDEDRRAEVAYSYSSSQNRKQLFINESGMYALILRSKLPTAKKFKHWVTSEVLPAIRKHGAYMTREKVAEVYRDPRKLAELFTALADEQDKNRALEKKVAEDAPKVAFTNAVLDEGKNITVGELAKLCYNDDTPVGRKRMFDWLCAHGYTLRSQFPEEKYPMTMPYQRWINAGIFLVRYTRKGTHKYPFTLVTPKGIVRLTSEFKKEAAAV